MDPQEHEAVIDKNSLIGGCLRLPITIDAGRLREEVEALPEGEWEGTSSRIGVHRAADAVFLRGYAPAEGERPIEDRAVLSRLPYCRNLIETVVPAPPLRCLLARLPGGRRIPKHSDLGDYFRRTLRVHIPVVSHRRAWMLCNGSTYVMAVGEVWVLNNSAPHGVWNADPLRSRTHLICDFPATDALVALLAKGERDLGRDLDYVEQEITGKQEKYAPS